MHRVMMFDRRGGHLGELAPADVFALEMREQVNGEHSLEVTTTCVLAKGQRLVFRDHRGKWREYEVAGTDALHESGERPLGTYYCTWSLQPDLMGTRVSAMPGVQTPVAASLALASALSGTSRWEVGTVTNTATGGASMYDTDGWSAMSTFVGTWGGEVDVTITVDPETGVTAREVDCYDAQGEQEAKRRFDFGADLRSVRRKYADGPLYCRISPRGKGEQTDAGGYGRKITIESVNGGLDFLENPDMVEAAKLPDGSGGWEYPTLIVENGDCETPADLKAWAQSVLADYTVPQATYELDVVQAAVEGVDAKGVSLGDAVQVVDRNFGDGVRIEARVVEVVTDELLGIPKKVVIGQVSQGLAGRFAKAERVEDAVRAINGGTMTTANYLNRLLERLNGEANATGGYTYITEGQGLRTYDVAVSDPLVGAEASQVVEMRGGTIRIANSKTAQGEWEWRTLIQSGLVASDVLTASNITTGTIESANHTNYWNLDTGEFRLSNQATVDGDPILVGFAIDYAQSTSASQSPDPDNDALWSAAMPPHEDGKYIWQRLSTKSAGQVEHVTTCVSGRDGSTGTNAVGVQLYARSPGWAVDGTTLSASNPASFSVSGTTATMQGTVSGTAISLWEAPPRDMADPLTYTFATGELAGSLGTWGRSIPAGSTTCYVTMATAISNGPTDDIARAEWSEPVALSTAGVDGLNAATVYLYRRSATWTYHGSEFVAPTPESFSVSGTTAAMPGTVEGTTLTIAGEGPAHPSAIAGYVGSTYTFETHELADVPTGWYTEIPDGDEAVWVTAACAVSSGATDFIAKAEWSGVVMLADSGTGVDQNEEQWYLSDSEASCTGGTWSTAQPALAKGKYLWLRVKTTWSDGAVTYSEPKLARAVNSAFYEAKTAAEQVVTLDQSLDMDGMMYRLTNGFEWEGIYQDPETGGYYINADMIMAGYLNAGLVKAGVLSDANGYNYWDMQTGEMHMSAVQKQATVQLYARVPSWSVHGTELKAGTASAMSVSGTTATIGAATVSGTTLTCSPAPAKPQVQTTYTFATGELSPMPSGWYRSVPQEDGAIWTVSASAVSSNTTKAIEPNDWSDPAFVADGTSGLTNAEQQWYLSTSPTAPTGGSWSNSQPALTGGRYLWSRMRLSWDDGSATYTEPVAANAVNSAHRQALTAAEQVVTLDDALDMEGVLRRLTNDFQEQGLYIEDGHLYVNASAIMAGYVNAALVKTGLLSDAAGLNYWNMQTGAFKLTSGASVGNQTLQDYVDGRASSAASSSWSSKTKTDVFNKLTNNGADQCIVMQNGQLYINAEYIRSMVLEVVKNNKTLFKADVDSKTVEIGNFSAAGTYLSCGPTSMSSTTSGIFLAGSDHGWTDIGNSGIRMNNGVLAIGSSTPGYSYIQGYVGSSAKARLDLASYLASSASGTQYTGAVLSGAAIGFVAPRLFLATSASAEFLTETKRGDQTYLSGLSASTSGGVTTLTPKKRTDTLVHGMVTATGEENLTAISVAASNHTHSYDDLTNKPTIPSPYTHPTYTGHTLGLYKVSVNSLGHVWDAATVTKDDITALGIPGSASSVKYDGTAKGSVNFAVSGSTLNITFTD